jgi:hypothetical protein
MNHLVGTSRDRFFTFGIISVNLSPSEPSTRFHEIDFHLQNHLGEFVNFGTISVGCHEIHLSPYESFR